MHVIFKDATGRRTEGILLAASQSCLRIIVRKHNDTMELRLVEGQWTSDEGDEVEIESLVSDGQTGVFSGLAPRTNAARN